MLNDPPIAGLTNPTVPGRNVGRFSMGQSPDIRFTVHQANPTIRSVAGYPMCTPRVAPGSAPPHPIIPGSFILLTEDDRCPQRNRPLDTAGAADGEGAENGDAGVRDCVEDAGLGWNQYPRIPARIRATAIAPAIFMAQHHTRNLSTSATKYFYSSLPETARRKDDSVNPF
jgi:hypothetical protein